GALLANNPHGDMHVAEIDIATGKVLTVFVLPYLVTQSTGTLSGFWTGERNLLLSSGMLLDFDFKTWVVTYDVGFWHGEGPDGRYWRLERIKYDEADQLIAKMGATKHAKSVNTLNLLFAAATVPDAKSARQLNEARGGFA